jgi:hypothetical protein
MLYVVDSLNESDIELIQIYKKSLLDGTVTKDESLFVIEELEKSCIVKADHYSILKSNIK